MKSKFFHHLLVLGAGAAAILGVSAMEPNPEPYEVEQPDGSKLTVRMVGSEHDPSEEDSEGYAVIGGGASGTEYEYAELDEETGDLVPSGVKAGRNASRPARLRKGLRRQGRAKLAIGLGGEGPLSPRARGRGRGRGRGRDSGRSSQPNVELPTRRLSHVDYYGQNWNEQVEDFHRRTMSWTGTKRNLVIPMRFRDHSKRWLPSKSELNILFNNIGPNPTYAPTGSVRDVFKVSSYGALNMVSDIEDWVDLSQTESYYADGARGFTTVIHQAMREALNYLENTRRVDFSKYDTDNDGLIDAICFLHSGYAAEWGGNSEDGANYLDRIWSHKWSLYSIREPSTARAPGWTSKRYNVRVYNYHISPAVYGTHPTGKPIKDKMGRIGVIAHETGHFLGITDLYDTGDDPGNGSGSWELMANSWGFANDQQCIPIFSPWSKIELGWLKPKVISSSGSFAISPSYYTKDVYMISKGYPNDEYLLLEYRKNIGFESCMPTAGGLAVWHIDNKADYNSQGWPGQAGWPDNGKHYRISLLQADGKYDLERQRNRGDGTDLFFAGNKNFIGPFSKTRAHPNTDSYQTGNIVGTGIEIKNIGSPGNKISFDVVMPGTPLSTLAAPVRIPDAVQTTSTGSLGCSGDQKKLKVDITTDDFGSETSWEVSDPFNGRGVIRNGGPYLDRVRTYSHESCLPAAACYSFVISDSGKDGLSGSGTWKVIWDGDVIGQPKGAYSFVNDGVDFGDSCMPSGATVANIGLSGASKYYGVMFDIQAVNNIVVRRFSDIHTSANKAYTLKVFTKNGSYKGYERSPEAWTLVSQQILTGSGYKQFTSTNEVDFNQVVPILAQTTQAFYVVIDLPDQVFLRSSSLTEGRPYKSFDDLVVKTGVYNELNFGYFAEPAGFNGKITYANLQIGKSGSDVIDDENTNDDLPIADALPPDADVQKAIEEADSATELTEIVETEMDIINVDEQENGLDEEYGDESDNYELETDAGSKYEENEKILSNEEMDSIEVIISNNEMDSNEQEAIQDGRWAGRKYMWRGGRRNS